jgi:hypothetical protein
MSNLTATSGSADPIGDVIDAALGRAHRNDPVRARTGGPAGNARLTAWLGIALLGIFAAEGLTLLGVGGLMTWHVFIGALLVPLALAKTATTGWRIVRYYLGSADYRQAGPPPLLLRLLGPLVILTALAVLGTGLALIALGDASFDNLITVGGVGIDAVTLHKAAFILWLAVTTVHVLTRTVPALRSAMGATPGARVPGSVARALAVVATILIGVAVGLVMVHLSGDWIHHRIDQQGFGNLAPTPAGHAPH